MSELCCRNEDTPITISRTTPFWRLLPPLNHANNNCPFLPKHTQNNRTLVKVAGNYYERLTLGLRPPAPSSSESLPLLPSVSGPLPPRRTPLPGLPYPPTRPCTPSPFPFPRVVSLTSSVSFESTVRTEEAGLTSGGWGCDDGGREGLRDGDRSERRASGLSALCFSSQNGAYSERLR